MSDTAHTHFNVWLCLRTVLEHAEAMPIVAHPMRLLIDMAMACWLST